LALIIIRSKFVLEELVVVPDKGLQQVSRGWRPNQKETNLERMWQWFRFKLHSFLACIYKNDVLAFSPCSF
jgi:hypothetical protein